MKKNSTKKKYLSSIPRKDGELLIWLANFIARIDTIGALLGLTPAQITELKDWAEFLMDAINNTGAKRAQYQEAVSAKKLARANELKQLINAALGFKRNPFFTDAIGDALQIMNAILLYDAGQLKPAVKATAHVGKVELAFNLQGMSCVTIYSRIKGSFGWTRLGNDYTSPYEDKRPLAVEHQPEIREYMIRYFDGREDIGLESDVVPVVFGG